MKRKCGEVTAFLSLVFVLLLSFILAMMQSAVIQTQKNMSRLNVDRSIFSVFGEYQKELLEQYEIFAFDASYGSGEFNEELILNRFAYYGSMGIQQEITDIQLLTDNNGQAFREAVITFMEEKSGIGAMRELSGWTREWAEQSISGEEISEDLKQSLVENEEVLPEEATALVNGTTSGNFLSLVLPKSFELSGKSILLSEQVSGRSNHIGRGAFPMQQGLGGIEEKLLYQQYVMDKFGTAVEQKGENRSLDYEVEYLICGNESDTENLKEVVTKILLFRLAMNYMYLRTDSTRQQEAAAMATAISIALLHPEAELVIRQLLLVLWAFGESILDVRALLEGNKAAFHKTDENWQLTLSSLFRLGSAEDEMQGAAEEEGLDYGQYLQILLYLESEEELTMRTLDRVEQNMIVERGFSLFRADNCVTKIKLSNTAEVGAGYQYTFPVYYGYL